MQGLNTTSEEGQRALFRMCGMLGIGLLQTQVSVQIGFWYDRSAEFMLNPALEFICWLRVIGDILLAVGTLALGWFLIKIK